MSAPLLLLCMLALFGGLLQIPLDSVFPVPVEARGHHGFLLVSSLTIAAPIAGLVIAVLFYLTGTFSAQRLKAHSWVKLLQQFWFSGWGLDSSL